MLQLRFATSRSAPGALPLRPTVFGNSRIFSNTSGVCRRPGSSLTRRQSLVCVAAAKAKFSSFQEMVTQSEYVLVDFYATWCGPCQMMSQIMEEAKGRIKNVTFTKVNTEKYPNIASQFDVQALPTLVLFKNGRPVKRVEGVLIASDLKKWIEQAIMS